MGAESGEPTLARQAAEYIQKKFNKPGKAFIGVVSRLDRLVSGVLVLARTSKAASRLSEQIRQHEVGKSYVAIVEGHWPVSNQWHELVDWLAKDESNHRMRVVDSSWTGALMARLRVRSLASTGTLSLLQIELITGRKHQIRVQLSAYGTAICGDAKYGSKRKFGPGIALHCREVVIQHPTRKEPLTFRTSALHHWNHVPAEFKSSLILDEQ